MRTLALAAAAATLAAALAAAAAPDRRPARGPVPEAKVGLARGGPMEVLPPPGVKENASAPGDRPVRPRAYPGAPPAVPHGVADFLPVTPTENACVDCHAVPEKRKGEPTPIPPSHYEDRRNAPGRRGEKVAGARWSCTACHLPQHDVRPLVGSPFPR